MCTEIASSYSLGVKKLLLVLQAMLFLVCILSEFKAVESASFRQRYSK